MTAATVCAACSRRRPSVGSAAVSVDAGRAQPSARMHLVPARDVMESFFSSLKTERTATKVYRSREQARADVFDYIERFYNPTRRHSTLGYVSPIQFEKAQKA